MRVPVEMHAAVFDYMRLQGVGVNLHYIPVHLQPYYRQMGFSAGQFPQAEAYYKEAISIPMYPGLTKEEQNYVIESLKLALSLRDI